jgi:hypothetical protein
MNDTTRKPIDAGALATGILMIAVGTLFMLDRLDIADFGDTIRSYWPLIVVAVGATRLVKGEVWGGVWLIVVGAWLQMAHMHIFGLTFSSSWPLLIIAVGAGMILRTLIESSRRREPASPEDRHEIH